MDAYLNQYWPDGGEEEGAGYFGVSPMCYFECVNFLESATGNSTGIFANPFIDAMGRYILNAHVAGDNYIDYGDAHTHAAPDGDLLYRYGKSVHDEQLQGFGAWCATRDGWTSSGDGVKRELDANLVFMSRAMPAVLEANEIRGAKQEEGLLRDSYYPSLGLATARVRAGSPEGMYFAALAANNGRSHSHNDTGSYIPDESSETKCDGSRTMRSIPRHIPGCVLFLAGALSGAQAPAAALVPVAASGQARAAIVLGDSAGESVRFAAAELQKYFRAMSGAEIAVVAAGQTASRPAGESWILVGAPGQNPLVQQALHSCALAFDGLSGDAFVLKTCLLGQRPVVVAGGNGDAATLYSVFELAERMGVTFRLTGDIVPERCSSLSIPALDLRRQPALGRRGFLLEASHHPSITMLSYQDYRRLLDQMAKMKLNFLEFWWFAYQPWLKYSYRGESKLIGDMSDKNSGFLNSLYEGYGSRTTDDVSIGKDKFPRRHLAPPELSDVEPPSRPSPPPRPCCAASSITPNPATSTCGWSTRWPHCLPTSADIPSESARSPSTNPTNPKSGDIRNPEIRESGIRAIRAIRGQSGDSTIRGIPGNPSGQSGGNPGTVQSGESRGIRGQYTQSPIPRPQCLASPMNNPPLFNHLEI